METSLTYNNHNGILIANFDPSKREKSWGKPAIELKMEHISEPTAAI